MFRTRVDVHWLPGNTRLWYEVGTGRGTSEYVPHYAAQSNVTLAPTLRGKLLLMVGEMDRNVDPASTMQVVDALVKANKDFELLVVPGGGHGISQTPVGKRRLQEFFVRNLLGGEQQQTAPTPG